MPKKRSTFLSDKTLEIIGGRPVSAMVNQTFQRLFVAGEDVELTELDRQIASGYQKIHCGRYEDQGKLLNDFASKTGRTIPESIVALDKIEREQS